MLYYRVVQTNADLGKTFSEEATVCFCFRVPRLPWRKTPPKLIPGDAVPCVSHGTKGTNGINPTISRNIRTFGILILSTNAHCISGQIGSIFYTLGCRVSEKLHPGRECNTIAGVDLPAQANFLRSARIK